MMNNVSSQLALRDTLLGRGFREAEADALVTTAAPAAQFRIGPSGEEAPLGSSKLAGLPDLPKGILWPERPAYSPSFHHISGGYEAIQRLKTGQIKYPEPHMIPSQIAQIERQIDICSNPAHLPFIGQINLADAWAAQPDLPPELPREGLISLFYDFEFQSSGIPGEEEIKFRVVYSETDDLERRALPLSLQDIVASDRDVKSQKRRDKHLGDARKKQGRFERLLGKAPKVDVTKLRPLEPLLPVEKRLDLEPVYTLPDFGILFNAICKVTPDYDREDDETPLSNLFYFRDDNYRFGQIGGHAHDLQGPEMPMEAQFATNGARWGVPEDAALRDQLLPGVKDWVLLAQFGSDDGVWSWGDAGILYVWMRRQDIAARAFDKAWVIEQSH